MPNSSLRSLPGGKRLTLSPFLFPLCRVVPRDQGCPASPPHLHPGRAPRLLCSTHQGLRWSEGSRSPAQGQILPFSRKVNPTRYHHRYGRDVSKVKCGAICRKCSTPSCVVCRNCREGGNWSCMLWPSLWHQAVGTEDADPRSRSLASMQCVPGRLSPGPAASQQHLKLCGDAWDGSHHRAHLCVDLFGLMWA